jgi:hypothetical protein
MAEPRKDELDAAPESLLEGSYCTAIEHFFSTASRDLIGRFLTSFVDSLFITPTELVHSAKYQKRLHDAGRVMMNAVDKIATMQARYKGESAAKRVKDLHALISAASKKVWDDEKERPIPALTPETFADVVARFDPADPERDYLINRALAEYLSQFKVWKDKIAVLVRMVRLSEGRDENRFVEYILGECLRSEPALDNLFGMPDRLEVRCNDLIDLWKGEWQPRDTAARVVAEINALVAEGKTPNLKAGLEYSLLRTLAGKEAIRSAEPDTEIQAMFDLFRRMRSGNTLIGGGKALGLLEKRQGRHINKESVTDLLRDRKVLCDRVAYLLVLASQAIGQGNRALLRTFIEHYFADKDFVPRIVAGHEPPVPKMQVLTTVHRALRASWLSEDEKTAYTGQVEVAQADLLKRSRLFEQVDKKGGSSSQKALTLLDMCRRGTFIETGTLDIVRQVIGRYLQDPQFMPDYLSGTGYGEERDRKIALLVKTLGAFGIRYTP